MGENPLKIKLQKLTGATVAELTVALIVLGGAVAGFIINNFYEPDTQQTSDDIFFTLDSLAKAQQSTYTGTDFEGNPDTGLAKADTVVEKESLFPQANKKKEPDGKLDLNTASKVELMKLPGVGEITALKIIKFREKSPFKKPADIQKIKGIGPKKFEKMKKYIELAK
jgi:competence ComEA-like helix-hairpin-helix protein